MACLAGIDCVWRAASCFARAQRKGVAAARSTTRTWTLRPSFMRRSKVSDTSFAYHSVSPQLAQIHASKLPTSVRYPLPVGRRRPSSGPRRSRRGAGRPCRPGPAPAGGPRRRRRSSCTNTSDRCQSSSSAHLTRDGLRSTRRSRGSRVSAAPQLTSRRLAGSRGSHRWQHVGPEGSLEGAAQGLQGGANRRRPVG